MILERKETDIQRARKLYKKDHSQKGIKIGTFVVILIFIAFFTSNLYLPASMTTKENVTKINEANSFADDRSFTLLKSRYSKKQKLLEVMIEFKNDSFDGVDKYYYSLDLKGTSQKGIKVKPVVEENVVSVILVSGVKKFDEAELYFAPKKGNIENVKDQDTGEIVLNKYNLEYGTIDTTKTKNDYMIEKFDLSISALQKKLEKKNDNVHSLESKAGGLNDEIDEYNKNEIYMTESEKEDAAQKISENETSIMELAEQIKNEKQEIKKLQNEISDAKDKREVLERK